MKILCVGNSYSEDATAYLQSMNDEFYVRNLYYPGCSLESHIDFLHTNKKVYVLEENGIHIESIENKVSLLEALELRDWDIVTIQQVSWLSGIESSYEPYMQELIDSINSKAPKAKIHFHRTWSYENGMEFPPFSVYENSSQVMFDMIKSATDIITKKYTLPVIPVGDVIQALRALSAFDEEQGGVALSRDKSHLSYDYGRYAAALTWSSYFCNNSSNTTFLPEGIDHKYTKLIKDCVNMVLTGYYISEK